MGQHPWDITGLSLENLKVSGIIWNLEESIREDYFGVPATSGGFIHFDSKLCSAGGAAKQPLEVHPEDSLGSRLVTAMWAMRPHQRRSRRVQVRLPPRTQVWRCDGDMIHWIYRAWMNAWPLCPIYLLKENWVTFSASCQLYESSAEICCFLVMLHSFAARQLANALRFG